MIMITMIMIMMIMKLIVVIIIMMCFIISTCSSSSSSKRPEPARAGRAQGRSSDCRSAITQVPIIDHQSAHPHSSARHRRHRRRGGEADRAIGEGYATREANLAIIANPSINLDDIDGSGVESASCTRPVRFVLSTIYIYIYSKIHVERVSILAHEAGSIRAGFSSVPPVL